MFLKIYLCFMKNIVQSLRVEVVRGSIERTAVREIE